MKTQQYQLTLYLPDDENQPAVAAPKRRQAPPKGSPIREAATCTPAIKLPDAEQPISRLSTTARAC